MKKPSDSILRIVFSNNLYMSRGRHSHLLPRTEPSIMNFNNTILIIHTCIRVCLRIIYWFGIKSVKKNFFNLPNSI